MRQLNNYFLNILSSNTINVWSMKGYVTGEMDVVFNSILIYFFTKLIHIKIMELAKNSRVDYLMNFFLFFFFIKKIINYKFMENFGLTEIKGVFNNNKQNLISYRKILLKNIKWEEG